MYVIFVVEASVRLKDRTPVAEAVRTVLVAEPSETVLPLDEAFHFLEDHDLERVPVMEESRLVGVLSRAVVQRRLAEDAARPALFYPMSAACWQPYFKGHTMMVNGNYNGWRLEDAWLDK